jgi:hypothetical protein
LNAPIWNERNCVPSVLIRLPCSGGACLESPEEAHHLERLVHAGLCDDEELVVIFESYLVYLLLDVQVLPTPYAQTVATKQLRQLLYHHLQLVSHIDCLESSHNCLFLQLQLNIQGN